MRPGLCLRGALPAGRNVDHKRLQLASVPQISQMQYVLVTSLWAGLNQVPPGIGAGGFLHMLFTHRVLRCVPFPPKPINPITITPRTGRLFSYLLSSRDINQLQMRSATLSLTFPGVWMLAPIRSLLSAHLAFGVDNMEDGCWV